MDALLNTLYKQLMAQLSEEHKLLLRDSQRKWLAFFEAESELSMALDPSAGGTLALINADAFTYETLKTRVKDLESYLGQDELE
jgi:uncharacterized protein YecT (DUF1311 family)